PAHTRKGAGTRRAGPHDPAVLSGIAAKLAGLDLQRGPTHAGEQRREHERELRLHPLVGVARPERSAEGEHRQALRLAWLAGVPAVEVADRDGLQISIRHLSSSS